MNGVERGPTPRDCGFNNRANRNTLIFRSSPKDRRNSFRYPKRTAGMGENDFAHRGGRPQTAP
jgi:hypothetical protein